MGKANWYLAGLLSVVIAGCSDGRTLSIEYPENQRAFHALNQQCKQAYAAGENEIQKSLVFNQCNRQRDDFANSENVSGWVGRLTDISTDQGADVVSVTIQSTINGSDVAYSTVSNRISDFATDSLITPSNPLFNVLAQMKEGDWVTFDASFLAHPEGERGIWEGSLTEQGSMDEPEFNVRFSSIRPYASAASPANSEAVDDSVSAPAGPQEPLTASENSQQQPSKEAEATESWQEIDDSANPSFDCQRASSKTEHAICTNATLARVDVYTADMYRCLLKRSPADKEKLKVEQRAWLPKRNACGDDVGCIRGAYGDIAQVYMTSPTFEECQSLVVGEAG